MPADSPDLRTRVAAQLAAHVVLDLSGLAIDGDDLIAALGLAPGPAVGTLLHALLERVMNDPTLNDGRPCLHSRRRWHATMVGSTVTPASRPGPGS